MKDTLMFSNILNLRGKARKISLSHQARKQSNCLGTIKTTAAAVAAALYVVHFCICFVLPQVFRHQHPLFCTAEIFLNIFQLGLWKTKAVEDKEADILGTLAEVI